MLTTLKYAHVQDADCQRKVPPYLITTKLASVPGYVAALPWPDYLYPATSS